ncbi:MAG TPA: hypothetical protein VMZ11_00315, partial [Mycobacteriales bacterium]|nr:hypothetical protein [Mycobacteriales bacterium]
YEVVKKQYLVPSGATLLADTACPTGKVPVGGGAFVGSVYAGHGNADAAYVAESGIDGTGSGWVTTLVVVAPTDPTTFTATIVCVSAGS